MKKSTIFRTAFMVVALMALSTSLFAKGSSEEISADSGVLLQKNAKYVFLFIGDGMAMPQINAAEAYLNQKTGSSIGVKQLGFTQFPAQGLTTTYDAGSFITDSASAGTAIATGNKTLSGVINMDVSKTVKYTTIAELAKSAGKKVGILSSVNLDHATPACFYAKEASRNDYYNIGMQLAASDFDFFAGGQVRISKTPKGEKSAHDIMMERGWQMASTREELAALKPGTTAYAYTTGFAAEALDYDMDRESDDISLAEFTKKGIELLDNEKGFFMMIEGGKIDWACHANDAAASIHDTIAFDNAVAEAIAFYNAHPEETTIIVTGDHETGGLALGFAGTKYDSAFEKIDAQTMSYEYFDTYILTPYKESHTADNARLDDLMPAIEKAFGLKEFSPLERKKLDAAFAQSMAAKDAKDTSDEAYLLYGGYEPLSVTLTHIANEQAGLGWTSYSHTGVPVSTFAMGVGQDLFNGYYDNTDVFKKMMDVMGIDTRVALK